MVCAERVFMQKHIIYMETGSLDPAYNLAFEEFILTRCLTGTYLLLWQNDSTIVIGQNQNAYEEVNLNFVKEHHIRVIRRTTGGGAVYHDLGNLNYSIITDLENSTRTATDLFISPIIHALQGLGLQAESSGRNDILIDGKKVSGTAQRIFQNRILHHGTLLFTSDLETLANALRVDPQKLQSKSIKSVRSRVGNIQDFLQSKMDISTFWSLMRTALAGDSFECKTLREDELSEVNRLKADKDDSWNWTYRPRPGNSMSSKRRWPGGSLEVFVTAKDGKISDIMFYGDFLSLRPLNDLTCALQGCSFEETTVRDVLSQYPIHLYFGKITLEEILETILSAQEM